MERAKIKSSLLKSVGYDAATEVLEVEFMRSNGFIYQYHSVPMTVALQMSQAESTGKFYLAEIKSKFKCIRIEAKDERKPKEEQEPEYSPEQEAESRGERERKWQDED